MINTYTGRAAALPHGVICCYVVDLWTNISAIHGGDILRNRYPMFERLTLSAPGQAVGKGAVVDLVFVFVSTMSTVMVFPGRPTV